MPLFLTAKPLCDKIQIFVGGIMKSLYDYDILNHVFYRSEKVLAYIERRMKRGETLDPLDQEAIAQTILHALVDTGVLNPTKEGLLFSKLAISPLGPEVITYQKTPFVMGFPLALKEQMRHFCLTVTEGMPLSLHAARPASHVHFCIYDANTALSFLFSEFSFISCSYDSPTRKGKKAENRPFLKASLDGVPYLFDLLTKRVFSYDEFAIRYHLTIEDGVSNQEFSEEQKERYQEMVESNTYGYQHYLAFSAPLFKALSQIPNMEEFFYELNKSKDYFPEAFQYAEKIMEKMSFEKEPFSFEKKITIPKEK